MPFLASCVGFALMVGWVLNFAKLFMETAAGMAVARGIGVVFFPLGMILGFF